VIANGAAIASTVSDIRRTLALLGPAVNTRRLSIMVPKLDAGDARRGLNLRQKQGLQSRPFE
jgi:hypothetical protein